MNLIYNISIFSLASQLISQSPLVCNHYTSFPRQVNIQNSYFHKHINPIYRSYESFSKFTISSSTIRNFLDQAIHVSKNIQFSDKRFFSPLNSIKTPFEKISVIKCAFISVNSRFCSGGAIQCFSSLLIIGSIFERCKTIRAGGAIASYHELEMDAVDIRYCEALFSSSIFHDSFHHVNVNLELTSTSRCRAPMSNGAITIKSNTNFLFSNSNLSLCESEGFYTGMWIDKSNVNVSFCYFNQNRNPDINGGITSIYTFSIFIDHTAFIDLRLKNKNNFAAVAIYIDKNLNKNSTISNCVFNYPDPLSASIHVRSGASIFIRTCCFSAPESDERRHFLLNFENGNSFGFQCELIKTKIKKPDIDELIRKINRNGSKKNSLLSNVIEDKFYLFYNICPLILAIIFSILFLII